MIFNEVMAKKTYYTIDRNDLDESVSDMLIIENADFIPNDETSMSLMFSARTISMMITDNDDGDNIDGLLKLHKFIEENNASAILVYEVY